MKLQLFKTLWGHRGSYQDAVDEAKKAGFHGIEGPAPESQEDMKQLQAFLDEKGMRFIAEITTAGTYVPDRQASLNNHIQSFQQKLEQSLDLNPAFVTCLGGCDAWPEEKSLDFFGQAMALADEYKTIVSFETHRGRSFFNPWTTQRIVQQLPNIKLTCDFSHWCVVCERLMDTEREVLEFIAPNAHHIHARVGYDQGPQVPHPGAPEYEYELRAHQDWWELIWKHQLERGYSITSMTPEFGPDGYLHETPFSRTPVGDLWEINQWMATEERSHFAEFMKNG